jgi:hypothetical protein
MKIKFLMLLILSYCTVAYCRGTQSEIPVKLKLNVRNLEVYHEFPNFVDYKKKTINKYDWGDIVIEVYFDDDLVYKIVDDYKEEYHPLYLRQPIKGVSNIWSKNDLYTFNANLNLDKQYKLRVKLYTKTCPKYYKNFGPNDTISLADSESIILTDGDELGINLHIDISPGTIKSISGHKGEIDLTTNIFHNNESKIAKENKTVKTLSERIKELQDLSEQGLITDDEFKIARKKILDNM